MIRFGLLVALVGTVLYVLARPRPGPDEAPLAPGWRRRGLRVVTVGFIVLWLGLLVAIGALR